MNFKWLRVMEGGFCCDGEVWPAELTVIEFQFKEPMLLAGF